MRILHISTESNFIDHALSTFERVYPEKNVVWKLDRNRESKTSNNKNNKNNKSFVFLDTFKPSFLRDLKQFDLIVLHSFDVYWFFLILLAPKGVKFAWLGWGFDYYEYIFKKTDDLLLSNTLNLKKKSDKISKKTVKLLVLSILDTIIKPLCLKRISSFSPVLKEDYDLIYNAKIIPFLPKFISWNYGGLEDNLIKNFIGHRVNGESILLGNSASFTNNHMEVIDFLNELKCLYDISTIVPLSYGNELYKNKIIEVGNAMLENSFQPVVDFMPIDEYVALIKQCGFVIMNHKRQQAVGNIIIMLYLGARVFLREENPTYIMLKKEGAVLNTVQELELNPKLIKLPLTEDEIQKNISILYKHWSVEAIDIKTKNLVEFHLGNAN